MEMNAEMDLSKLVSTPLLIAHGRDNLLHPIEEANHVFEKASSPKEFHLINGQHNDFMYADHPEFKQLIEKLVSFFEA
jgi:fermentation-respiration switch protein FrsA (DUF1100 family)